MVDFSLSIMEEACQILATSFGHIFLQNSKSDIFAKCPKIEVDYPDFGKKKEYLPLLFWN